MYLLTKSKMAKKWIYVIVILVLIMLMLITNFTPSVVRASTMGILAMFANLIDN